MSQTLSDGQVEICKDRSTSVTDAVESNSNRSVLDYPFKRAARMSIFRHDSSFSVFDSCDPVLLSQLQSNHGSAASGAEESHGASSENTSNGNAPGASGAEEGPRRRKNSGPRVPKAEDTTDHTPKDYTQEQFDLVRK